MLVEGFLLTLAPRMLFGMFCCGRGKVSVCVCVCVSVCVCVCYGVLCHGCYGVLCGCYGVMGVMGC